MNETSYKGFPAGVWFGTYSPEGEGHLDLHFLNGQGDNGVEAHELRQITDNRTGAVCYTLDGIYHTVESLGAIALFTLPLSDYLARGELGQQRWVHADSNIIPLEAFVSARGDTVSAQRLRETFPKIFAKPVVPDLQPKPTPKPQKRSRWRLAF